MLNKYFKFLGEDYAIELLIKAKSGLKGPPDIPKASKHQFYIRLSTARKLGLVFKCNGDYRLTSYGQLFLSNINHLMELKPVEWMFKSIDNIKDPEMKLKLIHQLFNERPDIIKCLKEN